MTLAVAAGPKRTSRRTLTVAIASLLAATLFWAGNYTRGRPGGSKPFFWRRWRAGNLEP
ncbi:hypothetical protein [Arthrobacter sp. ISL-65]|uniref:hypothetical protein n=1 Tax=Arthrobacter sp. ISL-65 TaxID=2819112 RepID=UPI001BECC028|nr:hypothetical protein [Arthrobacter sp. ISL-65]MBT2548644.1 hypothetical protein [Arthrobacter sp. ISL-65]